MVNLTVLVLKFNDEISSTDLLIRLLTRSYVSGFKEIKGETIALTIAIFATIPSIFRYLRLLGRFRALTILRLDYPALSDQTLNALTNAAPRVLKTLHISVRDSDSRHHTITDTAWHNLVLVCPELTVSYTIGTISYRVT